MRRRRSAVAGALALGLAAAASARAEQSDHRAATELVVPLDRTAVDVLSGFAAEACAKAVPGGADPAVRAGSEAPGALERAIASATEARMRTMASFRAARTSSTSSARICLVFTERREAFLTLQLRARDAAGERAISSAQVRWDAELAAIAGQSRSIAEGDVRAVSTPLRGRGYVAAATTRAPGAGALLYAVRAGGVDVYALASDARGRVRASRLASGERPAGERAPAPPRRPLATIEARGDDVEVTWADLLTPYGVSFDRGSLAYAPRAPCAPRGHRAFGLCAIRVPGRDYFSNRPPRGEAAEALPSAFYVRAESSIRGADGAAREVAALATAGGRLRITVGPHRAARRAPRGEAGVAGHGLAIAIADVDLDGQAEVLASSDRPLGEGDRLTLYRVRSAGTVVRLWRGAELSGSVAVAAAADVDGDGREELLAIEEPPSAAGEARLWVVR